MAEFSQSGRSLRIETPLGNDQLLLTGFAGREAISELFEFKLDLLSLDDAIDPRSIVGKNVTVTLALVDGSERTINGYINRFAYQGTGDRLSIYQANMVPWLWFLTKRTDCRIFQKQSVDQIIEQVFGEMGFPDYDVAGLQQSYPKLEYCVQYRESDYNFVTRLLEFYGIFYYFRHEQGRHTLVLGDSKNAFGDCPENEVHYTGPEATAGSAQDQIIRWEHQYEYRSGQWRQTDFNYQQVNTDLATTSQSVIGLDSQSKYERYDFPGAYGKRTDGDTYTDIRMEEEEAAWDRVFGDSKCRTFSPGLRFQLTDHRSSGEKGGYFVLTNVTHEMHHESAYVEGGEEPPFDYQNSFECIPADTNYRPPSLTPKPRVNGAQTATVVGPDGEEIYTDSDGYGCVKVKFHWDRADRSGENRTCWIRVAQMWAGKNWGVFSLPRMGQEVVVSFLEGDPDRPLVTGCVHNDKQRPPYSLPDNKTRSTIKTLSSKGGEGFNEIRFEDKKGSEQIFLHAERDQDVRTKNDSREYVGNERHILVKADEMIQTDGNRDEYIKTNRVSATDGSQHSAVGGDRVEQTTGKHHIHVKSDQISKVDMNKSVEVGMNRDTKVGMKEAVDAGQEIHLKSGMTAIIEAGVQLSLKVGGNFIDINPGGIFISGTLVNINNGGSAGSGSGASPDSPESPEWPTAPDEADNDQPGKVSAQQ